MSLEAQLEEFRERLETFIHLETESPVSIDHARPIPGGASRDTWLIMGTIDNEPTHLVLRRDLETEMVEQALTREQEFRLIKAAFESGVRVPRPRWYATDPSVLGKPFFIMDYVEGVSIGPKVVRDPDLETARQYLPEQLAQELATIHAVDIKAHDLDFLDTPEDWQSPAQKAVADVQAAVDKLDIKNPALVYGLRWCEQNAPICDSITLIHGDYRIGNLLVGPEGLNAIIDWEFSHVGDPAEDLAWSSVRDWRFGNGHLHFAGIADNETFISRYEKVSGRTVDRKAVAYWEILGNLRWATTCLQQANRHLSGGDPSVEFASLGRRSAEMQLEMLRLIKAWKD